MNIKIDKTFIVLIILTIIIFIVGIKLAISNPNEPILISVGIYLISIAVINAILTLIYFKNLNP